MVMTMRRALALLGAILALIGVSSGLAGCTTDTTAGGTESAPASEETSADEQEIRAAHLVIEEALNEGQAWTICEYTTGFRLDSCQSDVEELDADYEGTDDIKAITVEGDHAEISYTDTDEIEQWELDDDGQWKWSE